MTPAQKELQWLLTLLKPPYTQGWKNYCWDKAQKLAESEPKEYGDLPRLLKEAMQSASTSPAP